jgi:hypothetical protein
MQSGRDELNFAMAGDEAGLDLIPRSVRDKLDRVGIKLHLKEWQQLSVDERRELRDSACDDTATVDAYRSRLEAMVHHRSGRLPEKLTAKRSA